MQAGEVEVKNAIEGYLPPVGIFSGSRPGSKIVLQYHYHTPDQKNQWNMDPTGRISPLEESGFGGWWTHGVLVI